MRVLKWQEKNDGSSTGRCYKTMLIQVLNYSLQFLVVLFSVVVFFVVVDFGWTICL